MKGRQGGYFEGNFFQMRSERRGGRGRGRTRKRKNMQGRRVRLEEREDRMKGGRKVGGFSDVKGFDWT